MEWQHLKSVVTSLSQSLSNQLSSLNLESNFDIIYLAVYICLLIFRLPALPALTAVLGCSYTYEVTLALPAYQYWLICCVICSFTTTFYYRINERAWQGFAVLTVLLFTMAMEKGFAAIGWGQFYNSLYDSYELFVTAIHLLIVCLLIRWRRLARFLGKCAFPVFAG